MGVSGRWLFRLMSSHSSLLLEFLSYGHSASISQPSQVKIRTMQGILNLSG